MNKKQTNFNPFLLALGLLLLAGGLLLLKPCPGLAILPYLCIGLGCGAFGHGLGGILSRRALRRNPRLQKQLEIEQMDERNILISNQAKAKAYDIMIYVFGALMLALAFLQVDLAAILLLVAAYLIVVGFFLFYFNKYHREE